MKGRVQFYLTIIPTIVMLTFVGVILLYDKCVEIYEKVGANQHFAEVSAVITCLSVVVVVFVITALEFPEEKKS